jgi:hypothetical protein
MQEIDHRTGVEVTPGVKPARAAIPLSVRTHQRG